MKSSRGFLSIFLSLLVIMTMFGALVMAQGSEVWTRSEIDSSGNVGDFNSIAVDNDGSVHISYYDATNQHLKYATNAGGDWKEYVVDSGGGENATGQHTSIAIDSKNQVHIAYTSASNGSTSLKHATGSAGNWTKSFVDFTNVSGEWVPSALNPSATVSMALDRKDQVYISCQEKSGKLKLVSDAGGTWSNFTLVGADDDARGGDFNSIALDRGDNVFIAYHGTVSADNKTVSNLSLTTNSGGSWTNVTVDDSGNVGTYNSIKIGSSGIQIAYRDETEGSLEIASGTGTKWTTQTVASGDTGYFASLAVDGSPQIICENKSDLSLDYFSLNSGNWTRERVWNHGNGIARCSLAVNSTGGPQIAVQNPEGLNLVFISREGAAPPSEEVPSVPLNLTAVVNKTVSLTWDPPSSNGSGPITSYHIYRNESLIANVTVTSYNDSNVTPGDSLAYGVSAVNGAGEGPNASVNVTIGNATSVPSAPRNLKAQVGNQSINLTWDRPSSNGSSQVTSYHVYKNESLVANVTATNFNDSNVSAGSFRYDVSAVNQVGEGPNATVNATVLVTATVPSVVIDLNGTAGNGNVTLQWKEPSSNGTRPITIYHIYRNGSLIANVTKLNFTDTGLTNGVAYNYSVAAVNSIGEGPKTSITLTPVQPKSLPSAPQNLTAVTGNGFVNLSWRAPLSAGNATILDYRIYQNGSFVDSTGNGTILDFNVAGLVNGQMYEFNVSAVNEVGEGPNATISATPSTVPAAPTLTSATPGNGSVLLNWTAPEDDGGSLIKGYTVYWNAGGQQNVITLGNVLSFNHTGLLRGTTYNYQVSAFNLNGNGTKSEQLSATTWDVPGAPNLTAVWEGGAINLQWTTPQSNGPPIDYYIVYKNGQDIAHPSASPYQDMAIVSGQKYEYTVRAHNALGLGPASNTQILISPELPSAPSVSAVEGDSFVLLNWQAPSNGGAEIVNYTIYRGTESGNESLLIKVGNVLSFNDTAVKNDVTYYYIIAAVNGVGQGPTSSEVNATPFSPIPPECQIVASITNGTVGSGFSFTCVFNAPEAECRWDFGDGTSTNFSSSLSVTHSYNKTGEYTVTVECRDIHNRIANATTTVNVQAQAPASNSTPTIFIGIVIVLAVIAVIGLYIMRKRGI